MDQCYLIPYGVVGILHDLLTLYLGVCLALSRTPLYPTRKLRYRSAVGFTGWCMVVNYFMLYKENVEKCIHYWQLDLTTFGTVGFGLVFMMGVWGVFASSDEQSASDLPSDATLDGGQPLLSEDNGIASQEQTNVVSQETVESGAPEVSLTPKPTISIIMSRLWKRPDGGATPSNRMSGNTLDPEAQQSPAPPPNPGPVGVFLLWSAVLGLLVSLVVGAVSLAIDAVFHGSTGVAFVSGVFALPVVILISGFCFTFRRSVKEDDKLAARALLIICLWGFAIIYIDLVLGFTLGSVVGVPFPDIDGDELSRYWVYFTITKIPFLLF